MSQPPSDIHEQIVAHLKSLPIFNRLTLAELRKIYNICTFRRYAVDEYMYRFGDPSADMFILLDGRLAIRSRAGVDIAYISPITVVGEMGILTDQPRSTNVIILEESVGFMISKKDLIDLFIADSSICRKILLNIIKLLSSRLYDTSAEIEKLRTEQTQSKTGKPENDNIFLY